MLAARGIGSKIICEFHAEAAAILLDGVLGEIRRHRVAVVLIKQVIDAGGNFEILDQLAAEQRGVGNAERVNASPLDGFAAAHGLKLHRGKEVFPPHRHRQIEFGEMRGRIQQAVPARILGL